MLVIKMMSGEDKPDSSTDKGFMLYEVPDGHQVETLRSYDGEPAIKVWKGPEIPVTLYPAGNTYFMRDGKTIASFAFTSFSTNGSPIGTKVPDPKL